MNRIVAMRDLDFEIDGAALHAGAALSILGEIETVVANLPHERAGVRLHGMMPLRDLLSRGSIAALAERYLGPAARPVRAILFDKSAAANWTLGWHQDRTIAVQARHEVAGYGPWSIKAGVHHVEPPFDVVETMATLRIHLDNVPADNAPLLIAPGSHRLGKVAAGDARPTADRIGALACLARRGDIWAYATSILHASDRSIGDRRRRVLHADFSAIDLPSPLAWLGV